MNRFPFYSTSLLMAILLLSDCRTFAQTDLSGQTGCIHPSSVIHIRKVDPNSLSNAGPILQGDFKNELVENFKNQKRSIPGSVWKNAPRHSYSPVDNVPDICPPIVQTGFEGNPQTQFYHLPVGYYASECGIAISKAGKMVSISNYWMQYYNENGTLVFSDSLYHFANSLIDCHVLYDPKADRFVFSAQYGYYDPIVFNVYGTVIGFSKSNDPMDGWNFYQLPFTDFHDNSIGDYPLLAISNSEIFITIDYYNYTFTFKHVEIIQINKGQGYAGDASLISQKYDAPLTGNTKGTMVPAQGGSTTYGPNMYFIMANESGHSSNKYYVYEITNTIASGQAVLNRYGPVTSNVSYSACGTSYQPGGIPLVDLFAADNDFMENAFYENGIIQFCQITKANGKAAGLIGRISGIPNNLNCSAKTISDPDLYLSYPSIAYAGNSSTDNSAILGIEHTGVNTFPGLSAVFVNSNFDISALTTVKEGVDTINGLWGDYSGICRRYNHPGEVWFEGQYGSTVFPAINWITKLSKPVNCEDQSMVSSDPTEQTNPNVKIYPNPASKSMSISFSLHEAKEVSIKIMDAGGNFVKVLKDARMDSGDYALTWNTDEIPTGIYVLQFVAGTYTESKEISVIQ